MAGDKATPPAPVRSERRVSSGSGASEGGPLRFVMRLSRARAPGPASARGGAGHMSLARITDPSAQVWVAGAGGGERRRDHDGRNDRRGRR